MFTSKYFNAGRVEVTYRISEVMKENDRFALEVSLSLRRYLVKDWGNISEADKQVNTDALQYQDNMNLLAAYQTSEGKIYIITSRVSENAGDNGTTICFADER